MMPNLIHLAEYLGGGLGCILLGWVLRWGQHRDDCRAIERDAELDGYDRGWADRSRHQETLTEWTERRREELAAAYLQETDRNTPPFEEYAATHTIYPELAALAAEDVPRPEPGGFPGSAHEPEACDQQPDRPGHLESTQEWQARMDLEAAQWCARHGLRHESAWAA